MLVSAHDTTRYSILHCLSGVLMVLTLLHSTPTRAQESADYLSLIKQNLEKMDAEVMDEEWFFTMTTHRDGDVLVTRNNPTYDKPRRNELVTVNGEPPTPKRLAQFHKSEAKRLGDAEKRGDDGKFGSMVDLATLAFVEEVDSYAILSFVPNLKGMEKEREKFIGNLVLNTETALLEQISLENIGKVSPAFSVSLKTYKTVMSFVPIQGELLLGTLVSRIVGKVGFFKNIDVLVEVEFSEYTRMGAGPT